MRIAKVIGTVTLNRSHPSFDGTTLKLAVPLSLDDLQSNNEPQADFEVIWDELGADIGCRIAMSEGPEAAKPFRPQIKPVNAANAAILDHLEIDL
jgi:ethanolamine utilization protein EutN